MNKAEKKAKSLLKYIQKNPSLRFWQALLAWSELPYIVISPKPPKNISKELQDTFFIKD